MNEEEKIFSGNMFDPLKKELVRIKHNTHEQCRLYNTLDEFDTAAREKILKEILGDIGPGFYIQGPIQFNYGSHLHIGRNFFANYNLTILDDAPVYIGDNVALGPNVSLMAAAHPLLAEERMGTNADGITAFAEFAAPIRLGSNLWLGANVTVLGGVVIEDNCVIGAGSVVTRNIPKGYLAYGNPCCPVRPITEQDSERSRILAEDTAHFSFK